MQIKERTGSSDSYRYGFQGQEKDNEIKGEGNSLNYTFRMHDPRIGRFFALDPLSSQYPYYSPYAFSGNRVIDAVELEGKEPLHVWIEIAMALTKAKLSLNNTKERMAGPVTRNNEVINNNPYISEEKKDFFYKADAAVATAELQSKILVGTTITGGVVVGGGALVAEAGIGAGIVSSYEAYSTWYGSSTAYSYFSGGTSVVMADLFTVNSLKTSAIGFSLNSTAEYVSSGFDINAVSFKKNALTSPLGGLGGLTLKSSFKEDMETPGGFAPSSVKEFAINFTFGKVSDEIGKNIKAIKIPKFSSYMGTYLESLLQIGSKTATNVVKNEVKKDLTDNKKTSKKKRT